MSGLIGRTSALASALGSVQDRNGALLVGNAGIGKSALSTELGEQLAANNWHVESIRCSEMTTALAFAPLMHLFPDITLPDPSQLGSALIDRLLNRADGNPMVLIVDDLQHSDPGTASVIFGLLVHHDVRVVASTRPANINAPSVQTLWKDGHVDRIDIEPLDTSAVSQLVELMTGWPPDGELLSQLVRRAAGNPFYTIALTRAGLTTGAITCQAQTCSLVHELPESAEINDLLRSQLATVSNTERSLLEAIAVADNMPLELFGDIDAQRSIEKMIAAGLVSIDRTNPAHTTRCAHPLIGEHLRRHLPPGRSAAIHQLLVDRVDDLEKVSPFDRLRATVFALESGATVAPASLLQGAQVALHVIDLDLATRAAQQACDVAPSAESHLLLGTALALAGTVDEANVHFETAQRLDPNEDQSARMAVARANMAVFFEFNIANAEAILIKAFTTLESTAARAKVGATMIFPLVMSNRYREAVALGTELATYADIDPETELNILGMLGMAKFISASFQDLDRYIERGAELTKAGGAQSSLSQTQIKLSGAMLEMAQLRLDNAQRRVHASVDLYVLSRPSGGASTVWSLTLASIQSISGDINDAVVHTGLAVEQSKKNDVLGMHAMMVACAAAMLAQSGDSRRAQAMLDAVPAAQFELDTRATIWKGWADAWIVGMDDPAEGAKIAAAIGQLGCDRNMNMWAWSALHVAVRLGYASLVVDQLNEEAVASPVPLIQLIARQARAATDADAATLEAVAVEWSVIGAFSAAAETWVLAEQAHRNNGHETAANIAGVHAASAAAKCRGCVTPLITSIVNPLSDHETAVAQLAAGGSTSKEIAELRFVSPRTVDNQLRSVFKKLGLSGRAELGRIF